MVDYLIGAAVGYVLSLLTMLVIWSLCVISAQEGGEKKNERSLHTFSKWHEHHYRKR